MKTKSNIVIAGAIVGVGIISFISGSIINGNNSSSQPLVASEVQKMTDVPQTAEAKSVSDTKDSSINVNGSSSSTSGAFVASKAGKKYFPLTCGSAKTIKKENAIYFNTKEEAEASGRTQSVQCKY